MGMNMWFDLAGAHFEWQLPGFFLSKAFSSRLIQFEDDFSQFLPTRW